jgi:hypothetical protein
VECRGCQGNRRGIDRDLCTLIDRVCRRNAESCSPSLCSSLQPSLLSLPNERSMVACPISALPQKFSHEMSCCTPPEAAFFSRGARAIKGRHLAMVTD